MFGIQDIKLKNFLSRISFLKEFFSKFAFISVEKSFERNSYALNFPNYL